MASLLEVLRCAVGSTTFDIRNSRISVDQVRMWYSNGDFRSIEANVKRLSLPERDLSNLVQEITPLLRDYMHEETRLIGNGFFLVLGGSISDAYISVEALARMLVVASAKLAPQRVADLFIGWVGGAPLRVKEYAVLEGVRIEEPLADEDITVYSRKEESRRLALSSWAMPEEEDSVVVSREVDTAPAIYKPARKSWIDIEEDPWVQPALNGFRPKNTDVSWDRFCEAMALATDGFVGWREVWREWEEANACQIGGHGSELTKGDFRRTRTRNLISQDILAETKEIEAKRERPNTMNLDLAIRRWVRSHLGELEDQLIELRIALEALYALGGRGIAAAIANRGAWHLGTTLDERKAHYDTLRKVYRDGSNAIHAHGIKYAIQDEALLDRGRELCRKAVMKILDNGAPAWDDLVLGQELRE